jgi:integration host factor subunit beta
MTKIELVTAFAIEMDIASKEARSILDTILDTMSDALARGEGIELRGFCSFTVKHYKSFKGRNPKTGQPVTVKPKRLPYFKASKELMEEVNRNR